MRYAVLLLFFALAGCDLGTGNPDIQFSHSLLPESQGAQQTASLEGLNDAVFGAGIIVAPNSCQKITAAVDIKGNSLTITLTAANQRNDCQAGIGAYTYQLAISEIPARRYTAKIVYDFSGQRPAQTVLEEEIIVS